MLWIPESGLFSSRVNGGQGNLRKVTMLVGSNHNLLYGYFSSTQIFKPSKKKIDHTAQNLQTVKKWASQNKTSLKARRASYAQNVAILRNAVERIYWWRSWQAKTILWLRRLQHAAMKGDSDKINEPKQITNRENYLKIKTSNYY